MKSDECGLGVVILALSMATSGCDAGAGVLVGTGGTGVVTAGRGGQSVVVGTGGAGATPTGTAGVGDVCGGTPQRALRVAPSIMIVLDTSASMNDPADLSCPNGCVVQSRWAAAVDGINSEVDATAARINWGLTFIAGTKAACDPDLVALVGAGSVKLGLANRTSAGLLAAPGNRPTRAALDLAARYVAPGESGPGRVIVLITDGTPGCKAGDSDVLASDTADTLRAVTTAFSGGVSTFVVGLGTWNGPADRDLSDIAIYGGLSRAGSPAYYPASSSADVVIALHTLTMAMDCFFLLPPPRNDGTTSHASISVMAEGLPIAERSPNGWDYTDATLTAIQLHGTACDAVRGSGLAVDVVFHCPIP